MSERSPDYWRMRHEVRIAQRLCERTARLYRRVHTTCTFLSVIGGSAAMGALAPSLPAWVALAGAATLALSAAGSLSVRPAERAAQNESDAHKYAQLLTAATTMSDDEFAAALAKARESDVPELEPLRIVAYNDVMLEIGRPDLVGKLAPTQWLAAAMA